MIKGSYQDLQVEPPRFAYLDLFGWWSCRSIRTFSGSFSCSKKLTPQPRFHDKKIHKTTSQPVDPVDSRVDRNRSETSHAKVSGTRSQRRRPKNSLQLTKQTTHSSPLTTYQGLFGGKSPKKLSWPPEGSALLTAGAGAGPSSWTRWAASIYLPYGILLSVNIDDYKYSA